MLKRLSQVPAKSFALLSAAALLGLPCAAAVHARHASANAHATISHATLSHTTAGHGASGRAALSHTALSHAAASHAGSSHSFKSRRAEWVERAPAVHHEPVPAMEPGRATEIQAALIRAGYLSGQPTGVWDADSIAAMQKFQDDNGWQTKYTPDSRALVKLGLHGAPVQTASATEAAQPVSAQP